MEWGGTLRSLINQAMRCTSTRVFPEPGPATTRIGPSGAVTADCCSTLSPWRSGERVELTGGDSEMGVVVVTSLTVLGNSITVVRLILDQVVGVRIPVPQPAERTTSHCSN